jgi:hypothetical protein
MVVYFEREKVLQEFIHFTNINVKRLKCVDGCAESLSAVALGDAGRQNREVVGLRKHSSSLRGRVSARSWQAVENSTCAAERVSRNQHEGS